MGKVASSSIYFSIKQQYEGECLHAHTFTKYHKNFEIRYLYKSFNNDDIPIKIISLIREPISRNISAFFQNFERDTGFKYENNPYSVEELQLVFLNNYNHRIPLEWFDKNIKTNFEIDVFSKPFPEYGYALFNNDNVHLLLLKHDLKDELKEKLIAKFIGLEEFKLINSNVSDEKDYSAAYTNFKKLKLPNYYLETMLNSKYVNHFYFNDIEKIKSKWKKNS